jgi:transposase-like protein
MNFSRLGFTPEQKGQIVRHDLASTESISAIAEEVELQPSQIDLWVNVSAIHHHS